MSKTDVDKLTHNAVKGNEVLSMEKSIECFRNTEGHSAQSTEEGQKVSGHCSRRDI